MWVPVIYGADNRICSGDLILTKRYGAVVRGIAADDSPS